MDYVTVEKTIEWIWNNVNVEIIEKDEKFKKYNIARLAVKCYKDIE